MSVLFHYHYYLQTLKLSLSPNLLNKLNRISEQDENC